MRSLYLFCLGGVFSLFLLGNVRAATDPYPLMAWDYVDDAKTLKLMSDCGVNMVAFVRPQMLDACKKYKLKAIVFDESVASDDYAKPFDPKLADNLPALIKKVNKHPAVYGYHIKDEPGAGEFPALARSVAKVKELAPGKWPYINLYPGMGADYDTYLKQFVKVCQPTALSYDNYPLSMGEGKFSYGFWVNIAQVREAALKHDLPFWNIILTAPHWGYRELTQADLRLQMYGSLVYGARGISFYKFISASLPILKAPDLGNFRMAPLDQFGEKTSTWDWLRNVNHQVQNIGPTMLKLRSDDVYHIGGDLPDRNHRPTETNLVKNIAGEFVVGDFTHKDGTRYVMVVNKSLSQSYYCTPEFNVAPKKLQHVSSWTGKVETFPVPFYALAPGQGVLLRLE